MSPIKPTMDIQQLTIGQLAKKCAINIETIRFYERKGIIIQPQKINGFRKYAQHYIDRIKFIKRSQELGFTLSEAKELLDLSLKDHTKCGHILEKTQKKISEIQLKIHDLTKIKIALTQLENCCSDKNIPISDCPILDNFMEKK